MLGVNDMMIASASGSYLYSKLVGTGVSCLVLFIPNMPHEFQGSVDPILSLFFLAEVFGLVSQVYIKIRVSLTHSNMVHD